MVSRAGIKGLHHAAYRCRNSEETRSFYEDFLGLPLVDALKIDETITNKTTTTARQTSVLHTFFQMDDGSCIAFFEEPSEPFEFKRQRDFDLHIALEVNKEKLEAMFEKGKAQGIETRGISDHGFIHSIYFTDPNGYCVELTTPVGEKRVGKEFRDKARLAVKNFDAIHSRL
jgi:catechol 2,3-dioxygenase-like lactoylglutathione lyase family enzyme